MPLSKLPHERLAITDRLRDDLTEDQERLFDLRPGTRREVQDLWLEVDIDDTWRAAFRLVPYSGQPVVAEVRVFPADRWPGRQPGLWRAETLGMRSRQLDAKKLDKQQRSRDVRFPAIGRGIPAQLLRKVPFGVVQRYARELMELLGGLRDVDFLPDAIELEAAGFREHVPTERPRRPARWSDHRYAQLADTYAKRIEAGSRKPVEDVARRHRLETTQARDAIHTARKRGLLSPTTTQGRPGGQLTPAGEALLADAATTKKPTRQKRKKGK